jgi:hypothetical protein
MWILRRRVATSVEKERVSVKHVFISQSTGDPAPELESLIRAAFRNEVSVFNTSRDSSGLMAGDPMETEILKRITQSDALVWLASPTSVTRSFWMAWELGAARALDKPVILARCKGVSPKELPLLQSARFAPDIGNESGMREFLSSLAQTLMLDAPQIAEAMASKFIPKGKRSVFWGDANNGAIQMRLYTNRILIINKTKLDIELLAIQDDQGNSLDDDLLIELNSHLGAESRKTVHLSGNHSIRADQVIYIEWQAESEGRKHSSIKLGGPQ